jgi:hypothetical protein
MTKTIGKISETKSKMPKTKSQDCRGKLEGAQNYRRCPKPGGGVLASSIFETEASFAFRKFRAFRGSIQFHKPSKKPKTRAAQLRQSTSNLEK